MAIDTMSSCVICNELHDGRGKTCSKRCSVLLSWNGRRGKSKVPAKGKGFHFYGGSWWFHYCDGTGREHRNRGMVRDCEQCGRPFVARVSPLQKNCSPECGQKSKGLRTRGRQKLNGFAPIGAVRRRSTGYLEERVDFADPLVVMQTRNGWVLQHRLVMARAIGRPLVGRTETVHHINGDRSDNRLENLQMRRGNHGVGGCQVCLDCGSHNIGDVAIQDQEGVIPLV